MSESYEVLQAQFDAVKAKQDRKARNAVIDEIATHWDGLSVLRKMWSGSEVAEAIRAMKDKVPTPPSSAE